MPVDGRDDVEFLGDAEIGVGGEHALRRMLPARQRLDPDDLERAGIELRLVVGDELVPLEAVQDLVGDALGRRRSRAAAPR